MSAFITAALLIIGVWVFPATGYAAASHEGEKIAQVDVRGAIVTARETILAKLQTKPGGSYKDQVASEDIRRLFALGYFTDVRVELESASEGLVVVFVVKEKPAVTAIQVEGQHFLRKQRVLDLFTLKEGALYDPRKVKEGLDAIKAEYARKGFSQAEVVSNVKVDDAANTATLYLLVDEGPRTRITRVLVEGNQAFSDQQIRKVIKTKRRWLFGSGIYNSSVMDDDLERIRAFYRKHGYQDIEVTGNVYRDPKKHGLIVHLKVSEGLQHRVGQVAVEGVKLFPERDVLQAITLKPGAVYSTEGLQEDLRLIKQYYGDRGYIHAEVVPDPQLDSVNKRVNLVYRITENELVFVNRIEVEGNLHTKDVVIRRELRIYPGEQFDGAKIRKSIDRLYNLGYFEEVNVDTEKTAVQNQEDVVVKVKESKTGSFSFGGGFSSVDRLVGLVELEQRNFDFSNFPNFTGAGQDLRFRVEIGSVRRFFDLSFTEPWIFGYPLSFGVDGYNRTRLRSSSLGLGYEEDQRGGGVRFGKEFLDRITVSLSYQLYRTRISDIVDAASADLRAEAGSNTVSVAGTGVAFDTRNNRFDPTSGFYAFASADLAGGILGADKDFYRLQTGASYYFPHWDRLVFESRVKTGIVDAYGDSDEVPIFERFFGGGSGTIRGYEERRVGPRDRSSNDPIGGETSLSATLEEVLTVLKDEHNRPIFRGSVFIDTGNVWRRVNQYGDSLKTGVGFGTRITTPIGPLRFDIGFPLNEIQGEKKKPHFHFNLSRSF